MTQTTSERIMTPTRFLKKTLLASAAGGGLVLAACGGGTPEHHTRELDPVAVTVSAAVQASSTTALPARVVPLQEAEVATRMAGTIDRMAVNAGDWVARGDLLAVLDASDVRARIAAAEAQLELAQRTYTRMENLARDGAASEQEKDQAQAQLQSARAMVDEARAQAAYVEIRAPFAGVVTARMADPGDLAAPGHPMVQLQSDELKVVAELPADLADQVAVGDAVALSTDQGSMDGAIRRVVPALDRASRRFEVEITPAGRAGLLPGAFVRLQLAGAGESSRWIPHDAVVRHGQLTGVFTVESDTLRLRWLRLGRTQGEAVEVLSGPVGELTVVREPQAGLEDGQPVTRATSRSWAVAGGQPVDATQEDGAE